MAGGMCVRRSVCGRGACMTGGVHGRGPCGKATCGAEGHAWQGTCMAAGGYAWQGVYMAGGMHGGVTCVVGGMCGRRDGHLSFSQFVQSRQKWQFCIQRI